MWSVYTVYVFERGHKDYPQNKRTAKRTSSTATTKQKEEQNKHEILKCPTHSNSVTIDHENKKSIQS